MNTVLPLIHVPCGSVGPGLLPSFKEVGDELVPCFTLTEAED